MSFLPKHRVWNKGLKQVRIAEKRRGKVPQWRGTGLQHCPVEAEEAKSVCVQRERGPGWVGESEAVAQMSFPQSGHRMSSLSVRKPRPTSDSEHFLQLKQSLCHCRSSKEMYLVPPRPAEAGGRPGEDGEGAAQPGSRTVDSVSCLQPRGAGLPV